MSPTMVLPIQLAFRESDRIEVALLWHRSSERLTVSVLDTRSGESFALDASPERCLDVFNHPYAYAAERATRIEGLRAAARGRRSMRSPRPHRPGPLPPSSAFRLLSPRRSIEGIADPRMEGVAHVHS